MSKIMTIRFIVFKIWHTVRATFLAWLSIPFFTIGALLYWPAAFFLFCADSLKDNIPFNPLQIWKNIDSYKDSIDDFNFWTGKRK